MRPYSESRLFAIFYEHPRWFLPLFGALRKRGVEFDQLGPDLRFDPADLARPYSVIFNRMSPSAYLRGSTALFFTRDLIHYWECLGIRVINGSLAYRYEISKAAQLTLIHQLGLKAPATRVVHDVTDILAAAQTLRFPVMLKSNVGGSGAGIVKFDTQRELAAGITEKTVGNAIDGIWLVQEYVSPRDGHITRLETLGGNYLYAIDVFPEGNTFDLCPADACQTKEGKALNPGDAARPGEANSPGFRVEACDAETSLIHSCQRIARAAGIDVGGIESMIDDRTGDRIFYDVNALSNFVADAPNLIGFDPHARLADFLEEEILASAR